MVKSKVQFEFTPLTLATQDDSLLNEIAGVLYGKIISLKPYERISVFYWMASLKEFFAQRNSEFFQPINTATGGNLLGSILSKVVITPSIRTLCAGL